MLAALAACAYSADIVTTVNTSSEHTELQKLVSRAGGLIDALSTNPLTLFAPNNAGVDRAMTELGFNASNLTQEEANVLLPVLQYHIFAGNVSSADITTTPRYERSLEGPPIMLFREGSGSVRVRGKNVVDVVSPDIYATNGVIHSVEDVLFPPEDVVTVASGADFLSNLTAAIAKIDGLLATLLSLEDLTVFAPTNDAFATFFAEQGTTLDTIDTTVLEKVLKYHCFGSRLFSPTVFRGGDQDVESLSGDMVTVTVNGSTIMVNNATVTFYDVMITNGVVHVIDMVLMPPASSAPDGTTLTSTPDGTTLTSTPDGTSSTSTPEEDNKSSATVPFLTAFALCLMALLA